MTYYSTPPRSDELWHHGIKGMRWGVRRYQNEDGSLTPAGERHYYNSDGTLNRRGKRFIKKAGIKKIYREYNDPNDPNKFGAHDKSRAFEKKVDNGFTPTKNQFAKYAGPRKKTVLDQIRENRQKDKEKRMDFKQYRIQMKMANTEEERNKIRERYIKRHARSSGYTVKRDGTIYRRADFTAQPKVSKKEQKQKTYDAMKKAQNQYAYWRRSGNWDKAEEAWNKYDKLRVEYFSTKSRKVKPQPFVR